MIDPQLRRVLNSLEAGGLRVASGEEGETTMPGLLRAIDLGYVTDQSAANDPFSHFRLSVRGKLVLQGVPNPTVGQMAVAFIKQFLEPL